MAKKQRKRRLRPIKLDKKGEFYGYLRTGEYVRQKLDDEGCKEYRYKEVKPGVLVLICITKKKGPRGGRTKAVALLRHYKRDLRHYVKSEKKVYLAIKKARKLKLKQQQKQKKSKS